MAFIYMAGGWELRVPDTRDSITEQLSGAPSDRILALDVDFPAGGGTRPSPVTVRADQISVVSDMRLPNLS
jgi:hypothetical protein